MAKDTGMAAAKADTGMAAPPAAPALSDANIVYILDNANMLDSSAGSIAATKGTAADVRDFGQRMMRDHHSLLDRLQEPLAFGERQTQVLQHDLLIPHK